MRKNIIILTVGLTGSSVLTALLAKAGYWLGEATKKKAAYDTFENSTLVDVNKRIFLQAGYDGHYEMEFSQEALDLIEQTSGRINLAPYQEFVSMCDRNSPWIWKDPRLWLTIRFWDKVIDVSEYKFIVVTRDHTQTWISTLLMRQIHSYSYCQKYTEQVNNSIVDYLSENKADFVKIGFEDLVCRPESTIEELNQFLDISLSSDDLRAVYHKPLYKKPRGFFDFIRAILIYVKNYNTRRK